MPRTGRFSSIATPPARFLVAMVLATLVVLDGPAVAQQGASPSDRRTRVQARRARGKYRGGARSRVAAPVDPAAARARELLATVEWQEGPDIAGLGVIAEFRLPRGFVFTGAKGAKVYLELAQYPVPSELLGILAPYGSSEWFAVFESKKSARKDENARPDADALLREIRTDNDADNAARRSHGWAQRTDLDWEVRPAYDERSGNLSWTTRSSFAGRKVIRSTTRIFGKTGAIDVHLVARGDDLAPAGSALTNLLTVLEFTDGPNGGMRRDGLAGGGGGSGGSSSSHSSGVIVVPTGNYGNSAKGIRMITRSPSILGGGATAFFGAIGAAFKRKRRKEPTG